jgi:subtilisin family serine protease
MKRQFLVVLRGATAGATVLGGAMLLSSCGGSAPEAGSVPKDAASVSRSKSEIGAQAVSVTPGTDLVALARDYMAMVEGSVPEENLIRLKLPKTGGDLLLTKLRADPRVIFAETDDAFAAPESDGMMAGDPIHVPFDYIGIQDVAYSEMSMDYASASGVPTASGGNQAAYRQVNLGTVLQTTRGAGVIVAVLDTGVDASHPSLKGHLMTGFNTFAPETVPSDIADGTGNQVVGHGTMVAGIIARLAPNATILPIRVLDGDGSGSVLKTVAGVRYAVGHGARVLNLSLGGILRSAALEQAIQEAQAAGCVVVAAAGNAASTTPQYPAAYKDVLNVAALDAQNRKASFSNYGSSISLGAPGIGIYSTYVGGGYAAWSGTSFAAPFVSAAAALTLSAHPDWSGPKVGQRLWQTAESINAINKSLGGQLGKGVLDISRSVGK